jgi:ATP-binding cassette subfamily B protein
MSDISDTTKSRSLRPLGRLMHFALPYKGRVVLAIIALALAAVATLVLPLAVRGMIDHGFSDAALIDRYFLGLIAVAGVLAFASAWRYYLVMTLGERIVADIRGAVFAHLAALSPAFFDSARSGEIISRLTADTTLIKSAVGASASIALRNIIMFIGAVALMVFTAPRLSLYVLGVIPLVVLPLVGFGRDVRRRSRKAQDALAEASAYANENLGAIRTMQAFTAEKTVVGRFVKAVGEAYDAAAQATFSRSLLTAVAIFIVFASIVGILWAGARDVLSGTMSPGTLSQFMLYAVMAAGAMSELSQVWSEISQAAGSAERLGELLALEPGIKPPAHPKPLPSPAQGTLAFENVSFAYAGRPDQPVLKNLSFSVKAGERIAVVGPSGAGKSTLFHLLLRFYDPQSGRITIDGVDLKEADPQETRARLALVQQDATVFAASIAENITYGKTGTSRDAVVAAAKLAAADEFIMRMADGYNTEIGERGVMLSGGQRQRIAIARAILRDAPILLLDEATSALDAESETLVQQALDGVMAGRTTLVIAHRLATILDCDRILVMDDGQIVEQGTHSDLVAKGGLYARLAKLQFDVGIAAA